MANSLTELRDDGAFIFDCELKGWNFCLEGFFDEPECWCITYASPPPNDPVMKMFSDMISNISENEGYGIELNMEEAELFINLPIHHWLYDG